MNKKFIGLESVQIALAEMRPQSKPTIFFIHGNSGSSNSWNNQLKDPLFSDYHLVALDLPGHGDSSAPLKPEEDYSLPGMGKIMADSILKLNLTHPYILVGLSLGANIIAEMTPHLNPAGLVIVSSSVIGGDYTLQEAFMEGIDTSVYFGDDAAHENIVKAMHNASFNTQKDTHEILMTDYKATKPGFRPTMLKTYMEGKINDEIKLLKESDIPALVVFGKDEKMANPDYLDAMPFKTWKNKIFKLPEAGHYLQMDQPKKFNALLFEYVKDRFKEGS